MQGSHAQAGFFYQNNIAALKVLEMLRRGGISYITLENPRHAEHIDDVVVHYADRVEYTQVKWAVDDKASFTLYGIITPESEKKLSLLKQLADGYAYHIEFHRSVDRYKPETHMNWKVCEGIIAKDSTMIVRDCRFDGNSVQTMYAPTDAFI